VGNFGSKHRMDYTIIGGQVNLASRLESNANPNDILISHATYSLIKDDIFCEKKGTIFVKGIPYAIPTYKVVDFFNKIKQKDEINIVNDGISVYVDKDNLISNNKREEAINILNSIIKQIKELH
jgi:hypothetical protein